MEYIIVEDGIIAKHMCGPTVPEGAIEVPNGFGGYVGCKVAELKPDYSGMKPLSQRVKEGVTVMPEGMKIAEDDTTFVRMSQEEIDAQYPQKSYAEEGEHLEMLVSKSFDRDNNFGYFPQPGLVEMDRHQPTPAYKAVNGKWMYDLAKDKELKLEELSNLYEEVTEKPSVMSSLGFEIDANDKALQNINMLIDNTDANSTVMFCDFNNQFHSVKASQLATLKDEVVGRQQNLREQKWAIRDAVGKATTEAQMKAIVVQIQ